MSVRIIVDSASDITLDRAAELDIDVLPLKTIFGEEEFLDGVTMTHKEFYEKLIESDVHPTTSQVPPFDFEEKYAEAMEAGDTVIRTIGSTIGTHAGPGAIAVAFFVK